MPDDPDPHEPDYDWLYGQRRSGQSSAPSFGGTYPAPTDNPTDGQHPGTRIAAPPDAPPSQPRPSGAGPRPPGHPAPTPGRPRRRHPRQWLRIVLAVVVAWLVFLVAVPVYAWSRIDKVDAEPSGDRPDGGAGTTYLVVGSDSREGLTKEQKQSLGTGNASGQRTDTILLLHVAGGGGPNVLLSIPRDSYVDIPGHGKNKINAAFAFGGPKLLVQTVEQATGVRVDDYIEVGFTGVVDVVNAVSGITVCPKTPINDPKAGHLVMAKGCQEVDGQTALDYTRSRAFTNGDITRELHQREVIAAVGHKAASWQTFVLPWRYWQVNTAAADSLRIGKNVNPIALVRFAWAMAHIGGKGTKRCVVPFASLGTSTSVGSVVTWDTTKANALFHDIATDDTADIHCSAQ